MRVQGHKGVRGEDTRGVGAQVCKGCEGAMSEGARVLEVQGHKGAKGVRGMRAQECKGCEGTRGVRVQGYESTGL